MFITNKPAVLIEHGREKYLVISDIHLGITSDIRKKGVVIPNQVKSFVNRIDELRKTTKAKTLIILKSFPKPTTL